MSLRSKSRRSYKSIDEIFSSDRLGLFDDVHSKNNLGATRSTAQTNFEAINEFLDANNRKPSLDGPFAEKLLAVRLKSFRENPSDEVVEVDRYGLLDGFLRGEVESNEPTIDGVSACESEACELEGFSKATSEYKLTEDTEPELKKTQKTAINLHENNPPTLPQDIKNTAESFALEAEVFNVETSVSLQPKDTPKTLDDLLGRVEGLGLLDDVRPDIFEIPDELSVLRTRTMSDDDIIGKRDVCLDFDEYTSIFDFISKAMSEGLYTRHDFVREKSIHIGSVFIIDGLTAYVADKYLAEDREDKARRNERLRLIFSNGTESNILAFSVTTAQYKDYMGEFYQVEITDPEWVDLHFSEGFAGRHVDVKKISDNAAKKLNDEDEGDFIYIAKLNEKPDALQQYSDLYKIGMTRVNSARRTQGSKNDPTFLHRDVEVVGLWKLRNANIYKVESFLHKFFAQANIDMNVVTKDNRVHGAREWFDVPVSEIAKAINLIVDGDVTKYHYDVLDRRIKPRSSQY